MRMFCDVCAAVACIAWSVCRPPTEMVPSVGPLLALETLAASTTLQASSRTPSPRSSVVIPCGTPPSASCSAPHRKSYGTAAVCLGTRCSR